MAVLWGGIFLFTVLELSGPLYCGGSSFLLFFISLSANFIVGYYIDSSVFLIFFPHL